MRKILQKGTTITMVSSFEIPSNLTVDKLIADLTDKHTIERVTKQYTLKTFYDSFDWRLWRHDLTCEFNRSKTTSTLSLVDRKNLDTVASTALFDVPAFANQFNPGKVKQILEARLDIRSLIALGTVECETSQLNILDKDGYMALRLIIEEFELVKNRLTISPAKGHDKFAKDFAETISNQFALTPTDKPLLLDILQLQGRHPKDYSPKLNIALSPDLGTDAACKTIFLELLRVLKLNEQGVIADTDSEFLHDFRVAVRKTRVGLGLLKGIFPDDRLIEHKEFFNWLGQSSGDTRDLDVYLLNFEQYKKQLPKDIRQSINPLQHFLLAKKRKLHKQLAQKLRSTKYKTGLTKWQEFLASAAIVKIDENHASSEIKVFADQKIWQLYKRLIKQGEAIDRHSSPEVLHKLRKTGKKLRYLLEFFQCLYPTKKLEKCLDQLKELQNVLGDYQDSAMQQGRLKQFCEEMQTVNTPSKTFMAMGVLIKDFEIRKRKTRDRFTSQFAKFNKDENKSTFENLFKKAK